MMSHTEEKQAWERRKGGSYKVCQAQLLPSSPLACRDFSMPVKMRKALINQAWWLKPCPDWNLLVEGHYSTFLLPLLLYYTRRLLLLPTKHNSIRGINDFILPLGLNTVKVMVVPLLWRTLQQAVLFLLPTMLTRIFPPLLAKSL